MNKTAQFNDWIRWYPITFTFVVLSTFLCDQAFCRFYVFSNLLFVFCILSPYFECFDHQRKTEGQKNHHFENWRENKNKPSSGKKSICWFHVFSSLLPYFKAKWRKLCEKEEKTRKKQEKIYKSKALVDSYWSNIGWANITNTQTHIN